MTPIYKPTELTLPKGMDVFTKTTTPSRSYTLTSPVFLDDVDHKPCTRLLEVSVVFEGPFTYISFTEIVVVDGVQTRTPLVIRHATESAEVKQVLEKSLAHLHEHRVIYSQSNYVDGASATMIWLVWTLAHHLPSLCQFGDRPKIRNPTVSIVTQSETGELGYWKGCFHAPPFILPYLDQSGVKYYVSVTPRYMQVLCMGAVSEAGEFPIMYRSWVMLYLKMIYSDRPYLTLRRNITSAVDPISDRSQTPISFRYKGSIYKLGVVGGNLAVIELNGRRPARHREETINIFTIPTEG